MAKYKFEPRALEKLNDALKNMRETYPNPDNMVIKVVYLPTEHAKRNDTANMMRAMLSDDQEDIAFGQQSWITVCTWKALQSLIEHFGVFSDSIPYEFDTVCFELIISDVLCDEVYVDVLSEA